MEFREEAAMARVEREAGDRAQVMPRRTGRALAAGAVTVVFIFVGLFLAVPVGKDKRGSGQVVPANATVIRASREGTLEWTAPVGTAVETGALVASIGGGASRADLAATRARAQARLVDYLRFPRELRFAAAVPEAVASLRAEQVRARAGALRTSAAGEVLLAARRIGDAVRPGDLVAVVGHRDAPLQLQVSFPADAKPTPAPGDTVRFRWGDRTEQWATFGVTTVSYMAEDRQTPTDGAPPPANIQLIAMVDPDHAARLRPGLRGEV
nr:hypothetical protein [Deltaproteobacteria bacterium]